MTKKKAHSPNRSLYKLIYGLTDTEIDTLCDYAARRKSEKNDIEKLIHPAEIRAQTEIFSGDSSRDMWDRINKIKDSNQGLAWNTWDALYTVCCRIQELESIVRNHIKDEKPAGK